MACERSGLSCVFPDRARLPRGRKRGSKATNGEILKRLNKLEELLAQSKTREEGESGQHRKEGAPLGKGTENNSPSIDDGSRKGSLGAKENKVTTKEDVVEGIDRYLGGQFWKSFTSEVGG